MSQILSANVLVALPALISACSAPQSTVEGTDAATPTATAKPENSMASNDAPVNQRFPTLEAYLDWLRLTQGPVDGSWYEEIRPGVYQLRTGNLRILTPEGEATPAAQTFTRDELARKYGFTR